MLEGEGPYGSVEEEREGLRDKWWGGGGEQRGLKAYGIGSTLRAVGRVERGRMSIHVEKARDI